MDDSSNPAAAFACSISIHDACIKRAGTNASVELFSAYDGVEGFLRQIVRVGNFFERWACGHVEVERLSEEWASLLKARFGDACIEVMEAESIEGFSADDCLRVAFQLRLPMRIDGLLPLPVCVEAPTLIADADFRSVRIQTVRPDLADDGGMVPFTEDDDPFDEKFGSPIFGIYGVRSDGCLEHFADRASYQEARALVKALLPHTELPEQLVAFVRRAEL